MQIFMADLRHAWRRTRHHPCVTLAIIALLALGMGGVTAVFNATYSTLYSPLPFSQPEQLVRIGGDIPLFRTSTSSFEHEEATGHVFSHMAVWKQEQIQVRISDTGKQLHVNALRVSENFFETLRVKPLMGSDFTRTENRFGFVVSHRFWRNELSQKADAIGSHVLSSLGGPVAFFTTMPIIGVMPEGFNFPFDTDIWHWRKSGTPWVSLQSGVEQYQYIGRLHPGISVSRATEGLRSIRKNAQASGVIQGLAGRSGDGPILQSLQTFVYGDQQPMLRSLSATAILFLALACAGVINLLIAQGVKRKQEIATRLIYGASRRNLIFQLLIETLPLVIIGGLLGLWLSEMARAWMLAQIPTLRGGAVNVPVKIAFWSVLVMVVTVIGGLIPAFYATGLDLNTYLKLTSGGKRRFFSTQELLVGAQLSLALALLIGGSILIRSMIFNVDIPIVLSSRDIAVVSVTHPFDLSLTASEGRFWLNNDIRSEVSAMPEVMAVGIFSPIPFSQEAIRASKQSVYKTMPDRSTSFETLEGSVDASPVSAGVSPNGFDLLGIPIVIGRSFTEADAANVLEGVIRDDAKTPRVTVVIINQALARQLWREENPIGKVFFNRNRTSYEVVGVVRNFHHVPGNSDFIPAMYVPAAGTVMNHEFLAKLNPNASFQNFHSNVRQRLSGFMLEWTDAQPLSELIKDATSNQQLTLQLLICFAIFGIIVSSLGVYATAAGMVTARTKETGIRMAMGAQTWDILQLAFWRGIRVIIVGLPFGLFMAWIMAKALSGFLVQVNVGDPLSWTISCAILLVIATVAALIPALKTISVNPIDALRSE